MMKTKKVLLNETIYRTKKQAMEKNTVTRYLNWGIIEYECVDHKHITKHMIGTEDTTEEVPIFALTSEQDESIAEKGYWQCLHDGVKCAEVVKDIS